MTPFYEELRALINRHSRENASNTPDYILAQYLCACLAAFENAVALRSLLHSTPTSTLEMNNTPGPEEPRP